MAARSLFLAADPLQAYVTVRDRHVEPLPGTADVELRARRSGCPGGVAVGVDVPEGEVRPGGQPGFYLVNAEVAAAGITRAYQPWHADVESDPVQRWKGYLDDTYNLTLRNLLGEQTPDTLRSAEDARVEARMIELDADPARARTFDLDHLRGIHRHLFQDVYPWAGETRTVDLKRPGAPMFVPWEDVEDRWAGVARQVAGAGRMVGLGREEFARAAAGVYNEVNTIHAFREGNGRTQRTWMDHLAAEAGYDFDWLRISGPVNDHASRAAREGDPAPLRAMFEQITTEPPERTVTRPAPPAWSPQQAAALHEVTPRPGRPRSADPSPPERPRRPLGPQPPAPRR